LEQINQRLSAVTYFIDAKATATTLHETIESCGDLERLTSKLASRKIQPRELVQLEKSLTAVAAIKTILTPSTNPYLKQLATNLVVCQKTIDGRKNEQSTRIWNQFWITTTNTTKSLQRWYNSP
jgi:DNA mismatch repair protein MutS